MWFVKATAEVEVLKTTHRRIEIQMDAEHHRNNFIKRHAIAS